MYLIIKSLSSFIRVFYLPNPFDSLQGGLFINYMIEPFLWMLTYRIVGLYYRRVSSPTFGSMLYLLFYTVHVVLILFCANYDFNKFVMGSVLICYLMGHIGLSKLRNFVLR